MVIFGYSGWGSGQLEGEMEKDHWILSDIDLKITYKKSFINFEDSCKYLQGLKNQISNNTKWIFFHYLSLKCLSLIKPLPAIDSTLLTFFITFPAFKNSFIKI